MAAPPPAPLALVVIGATPAALHLLSRLPDRILRRSAVIDRRGAWLAGWADRCGRLDADAIRCAVTQCPGREPGALAAYADRQGRNAEISSRSPGWRLMRDFCDEVVLAALPQEVRNVVRDEVVGLGISRSQIGEGEGRDLCELELEGGGRVPALRVVVCVDPSEPIRPAWVPGSGVERADGIALGGEVDLRGADLSGVSVAIVGGGMASVVLAEGAARRGAREVTLICRGAIRRQDFEASRGWCGARRLRAFLALPPAKRFRAAMAARGSASIPPQCHARLRKLISGGGCRLLERHEVAAARCIGGQWRLMVIDASADRRVDIEVVAEKVWTCCGSAVNVGRHGLLAKLQVRCPTALVGGYPVLDDASLCWPGLPLHVLGPGALLALGPLAGSPAGWRLAVDRVAGAMLTSASGGVTPWERIRQKIEQGAQNEAADTVVDTAMDTVQGDRKRWEKSDNDRQRRERGHSADEFLASFGEEILARREAARYAWRDVGFHVRIDVPLEGEVADGSVGVFFSDSSVEAWAVASEGGATRFHIPRLYRRVVVDQCGYRLDASRGRLRIRLQKTSDSPWHFLKG
ncbi:unnamed protein product [Ostreobium quekettii]|uniref:L-ornithine N(5)-oxygenase n=1 Tax=Ostreobium quekettii TaxID=121088 RepID=A0A8S1IR83_9CHLO|nr:unnamed protein product [Ostreobium quekettii]